MLLTTTPAVVRSLSTAWTRPSFRVGVRHLANAGEYVEHAPAFLRTAAIKIR
jgi:hypothetical protein